MIKLSAENIREIIKLAEATPRVSKTAIARKFNVSHSVIIYHLRKTKPYLIKVKIKQEPKKKFEQYIPNLEKPKQYSDYLEDEHIRILKKRALCGHSHTIEVIRCSDCGEIIFSGTVQ